MPGRESPSPATSIHFPGNTNETFLLQEKVDAILNGKLDPSACCSYGICKGDVVISVGE